MTLRASIALRACPNFVASPLSRWRVRMTAQLHVNKLTQFARMLTLLTRKKKTPLLTKRCCIHGSTQLLQEPHLRLLFFLHDNDCRRTRLPAFALTRPLRNALHQDLLPELLSAGDSSSLLLSFLVTLFFSAFLYSSLYAEETEFVKGF